MIYKRLDIIPLKIYLEIDATGKLTLLIKGKHKRMSFSKLQEIWDSLKEQYSELGLASNDNKLLNLSIRIERLVSKYDAVNICLTCLKFNRDIDLENALREFGYTLREAYFKSDLEHIERLTSDIIVKIGRLKKNLPKDDKKSNAKNTIDKLIMSYCVITGLDYKPNEITVTEFDGLKSIFEQKMKETIKARTEAEAKLKNKK